MSFNNGKKKGNLQSQSSSEAQENKEGKQVYINGCIGYLGPRRNTPHKQGDWLRFPITDSTTFYKMSGYYLSKEGRLVEKIHCRKTQHMVH